MKNIRCVITDLDGTLLTTDKVVSDFNRDVIRKLSQTNIAFGIATGRPVEAVLKKMASENILEYIDVIVASNGVDIIEPKKNKMESTFQLSKADLLAIVELMKPLDVNFCVYGKEKMYTSRIDETILRIEKQNYLTPIIITPNELPLDKMNKVIFTVEPNRMPEVRAFMATLNQSKYNYFQSLPDLVEFVDGRVSKAVGLAIYAKKHGFSCDEVMVFGDTSNDIEMLEHCGWGVCMANGTADALAIAKDIALSNDEDGVGHYIKKAFSLE